MIVKIINRIRIILIIIFFRIKYNKSIICNNTFRFRKRLNIIIEKQGKIIIGKNVFFNNDCSLNCLGKIEIGDDCIFGENVKIYDHNHSFNCSKNIKEQGFSIGTVKIGNNCWIGTGVIILKDSKIGNNCVIGAGAVIKSVIPDNSIVKNNGKYKIEPINYK